MNTLQSKLDAAAMLHAIISGKVDWQKVNIKGLEDVAKEFKSHVFGLYFPEQLKTIKSCMNFTCHQLDESERQLLLNMHEKTFFAWSNEGEHVNQVELNLEEDERPSK